MRETLSTSGAMIVVLVVIVQLLASFLHCSAASAFDFGQASEVSIYVAPVGSDEWSGRFPEPATAEQDGPFASITRAQHEVRRLKEQGVTDDITVYIRGGVYYIDETIVFGLEDSGDRDQRIIYAAYPGEQPVISSGKKISGWRRLDEDCLKRLPDKAKGNIWVADVPEVADGRWRFYTLFDGDQRLPRARGDGFAPTVEYPGWTGPEVTHKTLHFPDGALADYENPEDVEILVRPTAAWALNILPLESVDTSTNTAVTAIPAMYQIGKMNYWGDTSESVWVENVVDVLDEPGEWVLNSREGRLYLWTTGDSPGDEILAPTLRELIRVEGDVDFDGPKDTPVHNLVFRGLAFTHGDRDTWDPDYRGLELQHGWDMYDRGNALVRFRGAEACVVEGCRFVNSGGSGVRLDLHSRNIRICDNEIGHIGATGVLLAGYGPGTKDVNGNNEVVNNHIHHVGELYWHAPGIFVWQSGSNLVANNLLHDLPYTGIVVSGRISFTRGAGECSRTVRWDEIGYVRTDYNSIEPYLHSRNNTLVDNEICRAVQVMADGNGIYVSGAGRGNVVRRNYIHDCVATGFVGAIRADDLQYDTLFTDNVVSRVGIGGGIETKGINHIENNIIVDLRLDPSYWFSYLNVTAGPVNGARIQRNIAYSTRFSDKLFAENALSYGLPAPIEDTETDHNIYFNEAYELWGDRHFMRYRRNGVELHSISADPLFYSAKDEDFRLRPESPALDLGFRQIDMSKIGLGEDFPFIDADDALSRLFIRSGERFAIVSLGPEDTAQLELIGRTQTGYVTDLSEATVSYTSDNPSVAQVDESGLITAMQEGRATVYAEVTVGEVEKSTCIAVAVNGDR